MWIFRICLAAGLLAHKAVWEVLKRRNSAAGKPTVVVRLKPVKAAKVAILLGIVAQTLWPADILPLSQDALLLRIVGVVIYSVGLATAILARLQLGKNWTDIEAPDVLGGHAVISTGPYRFIRHPIYVGDLVLLLGLELALNSWLVLGVVAMAPVVLRQAIREERMLRQRLPGYEAYLARTKRFFPFVV